MGDKPFFFDGSEISQDHKGSVTLSMTNYMKQLREILLAPGRRKELQNRANEAEMSEFRSVCGTLLWLGKGVLPPAAYGSSTL